MKATITQSHPRNSKPGHSVVYIESPLDQVANKFASKHGVYNLPFKCKTWSKICKEVSKTTSQTLKQLFEEALSIKFSSKAGCSCGCSPGYILKHEPNQYGRDFWVSLEASEQEIDAFSSLINSRRFETELQAEVLRELPVKYNAGN
jgi:hypothetical protein